MTTEQLNDLLAQGISNLSENCAADMSRCALQLRQVTEMLRRYVEDGTRVQADLEEDRKQNRLDVATRCLIAVRDAADKKGAFDAVSLILQSARRSNRRPRIKMPETYLEAFDEQGEWIREVARELNVDPECLAQWAWQAANEDIDDIPQG